MQKEFAMAQPRGMEARTVDPRRTGSDARVGFAECEHTSVLGALMTCAQLDCTPARSPRAGGHLLPLWNGLYGMEKHS